MGLTPGDFSGLSEANPSIWQTGNQKWTSVAKSWDTCYTFSARHDTVLGLGANGTKIELGENDTKIKWARFGHSKSPPLVGPFYDLTWKAELGMTTKSYRGSLGRGSAPENAIFSSKTMCSGNDLPRTC
jgi:hypothetical protein